MSEDDESIAASVVSELPPDQRQASGAEASSSKSKSRYTSLKLFKQRLHIRRFGRSRDRNHNQVVAFA